MKTFFIIFVCISPELLQGQVSTEVCQVAAGHKERLGQSLLQRRIQAHQNNVNEFTAESKDGLLTLEHILDVEGGTRDIEALKVAKTFEEDWEVGRSLSTDINSRHLPNQQKIEHNQLQDIAVGSTHKQNEDLAGVHAAYTNKHRKLSHEQLLVQHFAKLWQGADRATKQELQTEEQMRHNWMLEERALEQEPQRQQKSWQPKPKQSFAGMLPSWWKTIRRADSWQPRISIQQQPAAVNQQHQQGPGFAEHKQGKRHPHHGNKRVAYLLTGDSFRNRGAQLENGSCAPGSEGPQWQSLRSQVHDIIQPIEHAGYSVWVYGVTYPCSGGQRLVYDIPSFFGHRMHGFALTNRSNVTYGGQVKGWQHVINDVISDAEHASGQFDFYIITRWDLEATKPTTTAYWQCALNSSQSVARHLGHLNGYTTENGWGHFNMDFLMLIPAPLLKQLHSMLMSDPERCCSTAYMGTACVLCADNLNADSNTTEEASLICSKESIPLSLQKTAPLSLDSLNVVAQ